MTDNQPMKHCVLWPARCMDTLFQKHAASLKRPLAPEDFVDFGFEDALRQYYAENSAIVPNLNDRPLGLLPSTFLVRVRGMIQELKDPEMYPIAYVQTENIGHTSVTKTAKYLEALEKINYMKSTFDMSIVQTRTPGYLIPVPCETAWSRAKAHPPAPIADFYHFLSKRKNHKPAPVDLPPAERRPKRGRTMDVVPEDMSAMPSRLASFELPLGSKTNVTAVERGQYGRLDDEELTTPTAPITMSKEEDVHEHRVGRDANFPVPNNFGQSCWAKFYPPHEVNVNQVVDCIGIFTEAPSMTTYGADIADDSKFEGIPAPYAPRFHAVLVEHLGEANPLLPLNPAEFEAKRNHLFANIRHTRQEIINWMTVVLGGDALAAEYVLCNMIARPFSRSEDLSETNGHIPLNLTSLHPSLPEPILEQNGMDGMVAADDALQSPLWTRSVRGRLEYLLETLLPKRHTIPLTREHFATRNLCPYDHHEKGRLEAGELQLPAGTHVLFDETVLEEGELSPTETEAMQAISTFIHKQLVDFTFTVYKLPFKTDCPSIVLSQGRSLFNLTCVLRLDCDLLTPPPTPVDDETLDAWRSVLGFFRETEWLAQDEDVLQVVQNDFVEMRSMPENSFLTPELFTMWNALARASAVSFDEPSLCLDRWTYIKNLEHERLSRL